MKFKTLNRKCSVEISTIMKFIELWSPNRVLEDVSFVPEASNPPPPIMCIGSSSPTSKHSFSAISEKLDSENYLLWCHQVEPIIKAHKLLHFLLNPSIHVKYLTLDNANHNCLSPAFEAWEHQDQILLVWSQYAISREILTLVMPHIFYLPYNVYFERTWGMNSSFLRI